MTLFVEELISIGMVDSGDNPEAAIAIWKRREDAADRSADSADHPLQESNMTDVDLSALPDDAQAYITKLIDERDALLEQVNAVVSDDPVGDDDIAKNAPDEVRDLIAKQQARIAEQEEALHLEITKRRDTEFVAKVREDRMDILLGKAEESGPLLRRLADADPEAFNAVYGSMLAAAQRVDLAKAIAEFGENRGEGSDPHARKQAYVAKRREAGDERTIAEIESEFWKQNPELVRELRSR